MQHSESTYPRSVLSGYSTCLGLEFHPGDSGVTRSERCLAGDVRHCTYTLTDAQNEPYTFQHSKGDVTAGKSYEMTGGL